MRNSKDISTEILRNAPKTWLILFLLVLGSAVIYASLKTVGYSDAVSIFFPISIIFINLLVPAVIALQSGVVFAGQTVVSAKIIIATLLTSIGVVATGSKSRAFISNQLESTFTTASAQTSIVLWLLAVLVLLATGIVALWKEPIRYRALELLPMPYGRRPPSSQWILLIELPFKYQRTYDIESYRRYTIGNTRKRISSPYFIYVKDLDKPPVHVNILITGKGVLIEEVSFRKPHLGWLNKSRKRHRYLLSDKGVDFWVANAKISIKPLNRSELDFR